jgi:hypothetical protein
MFKYIEIKDKMDLKPGMFFGVDKDNMNLIDDIHRTEETLVFFTEGIKVDVEDLNDYVYAEFDTGDENIVAQISYSCNFCKNPNIVFNDIDNARLHADRCLFNEKKKSCVMCKHLKIIEHPPYPRYEKKYQSMETYHAFGAFKQPYCIKKEMNISEYELFDKHDDCFEYSDEPAVVETNEEFDHYWELVMKAQKQLTEEEVEELEKADEEVS